MSLLAEIHISAEDLAALCRKWRIAEMSLFGSVLGADFRPTSDIDVLVRFDREADWSTLDLIDLQQELSEMFRRTVDLVEELALRNPYRRRSILSNRKIVYAA